MLKMMNREFMRPRSQIPSLRVRGSTVVVSHPFRKARPGFILFLSRQTPTIGSDFLRQSESVRIHSAMGNKMFVALGG